MARSDRRREKNRAAPRPAAREPEDAPRKDKDEDPADAPSPTGPRDAESSSKPQSRPQSIRQSGRALRKFDTRLLERRLIFIVIGSILILGLIVSAIVALRENPDWGSARKAPPAAAPARDEPIIGETADLLARAKMAVRERDGSGAERILDALDAASATTEQRGEICNLRGVVEFQREHYPDAVAWFLKALAENDKNPVYYQNWAGALRALGHPAAALPPMRTALALAPADYVTNVKWSLLLIEAGQTSQVVSEISRLTKDGELPSQWGFAQVALFAVNGYEERARALLAGLRRHLTPEVYASCMEDPVMKKLSLD